MTIFFTNFVALSYNLIFFADDGWKVDGGMFKEEEGGLWKIYEKIYSLKKMIRIILIFLLGISQRQAK